MEPPVPASGRPDGKLRVIRVGRAAGEAYPGLRCTPSGLRMPHSGANFCAGRTRDKRLRVGFVFVLVVHNGEYTWGERQDARNSFDRLDCAHRRHRREPRITPCRQRRPRSVHPGAATRSVQETLGAHPGVHFRRQTVLPGAGTGAPRAAEPPCPGRDGAHGAVPTAARLEARHGFRQVTGGDTVDAAPVWVPGEPNLVLFQSSGLARNPDGYVIAHGPTSIQMAATAAGSLTVVLEDPRLDFLQPRVGANGFLYFIRRPYEAPRYGAKNILTDTLMFPFRLVRALFHYLNFFSLMYARKPLITASGPMLQADLKEILVKGKRLDAEAALRSGVRLNGVPSLVPASWQLVCRSPQGEERVLPSHVGSFDIAADGTILFSNGYGVFALDGANPPQVLLKDKLIANVIVGLPAVAGACDSPGEPGPVEQ